MTLPIWPPYPPMDAQSVGEIPTGKSWQYEPKWDGFRCLACRDKARVELQSKSSKPLARYFPELVAELTGLTATHFVLDGEIVVPVGKSFSFDMLLQRIHPAATRIKKLSRKHPARLIVFDLLVDAAGKNMAKMALRERRKALEAFWKKFVPRTARLSLSPATTDLKITDRWMKRAANALDGLIAKRLDLPYPPRQCTLAQVSRESGLPLLLVS